jgi:hypothetical protein
VVERDLGIGMDNKLKVTACVEKADSKTNQLIGLIKGSFVYTDIMLIKKLYIAIVRQHLKYGYVAWHSRFKKDTDLLEIVQPRATHLVPGNRDLPNSDRLRAMKLPSLCTGDS